MTNREYAQTGYVQPGMSVICPNCDGTGDDPETMICVMCGGDGVCTNDDDEPVNFFYVSDPDGIDILNPLGGTA
jgi:DnaJ-class molecular chaperone